MTPTAVIELGRQAVEVTLMVSAPLFLAALAGLIEECRAYIEDVA